MDRSNTEKLTQGSTQHVEPLYRSELLPKRCEGVRDEQTGPSGLSLTSSDDFAEFASPGE